MQGMAADNVCVVHVDWLYESLRRYCRADEGSFPLPGFEAAAGKHKPVVAVPDFQDVPLEDVLGEAADDAVTQEDGCTDGHHRKRTRVDPGTEDGLEVTAGAVVEGLDSASAPPAVDLKDESDSSDDTDLELEVCLECTRMWLIATVCAYDGCHFLHEQAELAAAMTGHEAHTED